jgi:hypothetical protein
MPIYRLEPIEDFMSEQSWRHSLVKASCWARAPDENQARLAIATMMATSPAEPADIMESPWLSPVLTMCIEESPAFQMEPEDAVNVNGIAQAWTAPLER